VALGSCTFTLVGYAFAGNTDDSARVAARIVAGSGFLGAGMLLGGRSSAQEMTTAFTIWLAAAVGMTFGAGYAGAALGLVLLTWAGLTVVRRTIHGDSGGSRESIVSIVINPDHGKTLIKLEHLLAEFSVSGRAVRRGESDKEREQWSIHYRLSERDQHEFFAALV
jgi:uncharacterized membrane protein YhiD involved in acid resistance